MIAPAVNTHHSTSSLVQYCAKNAKLALLLEKLGPELCSTPSINGKISAAFMKLLGHGKFSLGLISDSNSKLISRDGLETSNGHSPAGASFK